MKYNIEKFVLGYADPTATEGDGFYILCGNWVNNKTQFYGGNLFKDLPIGFASEIYNEEEALQRLKMVRESGNEFINIRLKDDDGKVTKQPVLTELIGIFRLNMAFEPAVLQSNTQQNKL